jgi:hypothetical protein
MKSYFALSPAEIAQHYVDSRGDPSFLPDTATQLVEDVRQYLARAGLGHRQEDAVEIAQAAYQLACEALVQQPPASQAEATFRADVQQGTTADDELAMHQADDRVLATPVQQMSMAEYGANRARFGLAQNLASFLGGNDQ